MMKQPTVSVIIASYQCDRYIGQAIQSVLDQTCCSIELLFVDDGSTDNTAEVVDFYTQYTNAQTTLQYLYQENQGVCAARNHGIEIATGEFLVFLDADDYFLPNKLIHQTALFDANPQLGLVHSGWRKVNEQGHPLQDIKLWESVPILNLETWLRFKPVLPSAMMFRRSWIERIGGFNPVYQVAEDVDLVLRLALAGCQSDWLQEITVAYRQHASNTMKDGSAQYRDLQKVLNAFFATPNLPDHIKLIEPNVRYNTLVWIACYLHGTGRLDQMIPPLQQAFFLSPYGLTQTTVNWIESLTAYANNNHRDIDIEALAQSSEWKTLMKWIVEKTLQSDIKAD